jgi:serine/threonine protein kinase
MAPEIVEKKHWDHAVDLWAVGVLLFVLLGGYMPFDPSNSIHDKKVCDRILRAKPAYTKDSGGYPEQWERVSAAARAPAREDPPLALAPCDAARRQAPGDFFASQLFRVPPQASTAPGN